MADQIQRRQRRAIQYWFVDGLAEIGLGCSFLLLGLYFEAHQIWPDSPWITIGAMVVLFILSFAGRGLIQQLKVRSTYPRSGYVAYDGNSRREIAFSIGFSILVLGVVLFLNKQDPKMFDWTPLAVGLILACFFAWTGYTTHLIHFYILGVFCLFCGGALAFSGVGGWAATALLCGMLGLILLSSGFLRRQAYLHRYPGQSEEPDER